MPGDEVAPDHEVRLSEIRREINPVIPGVTDLTEHFAERAFVQRLAVHDHAVHVENDGLKFVIHLLAGGTRFVASHSIVTTELRDQGDDKASPSNPVQRQSFGRSTRCIRFPSPSLKNRTRPPPPAGLIGSSNLTPFSDSWSRAASMDSTRNARCRQPASLLLLVSGRAASAG